MSKIKDSYVTEQINLLGKHSMMKTILFADDREKEILKRQFAALKIMRTSCFVPIYRFIVEDDRIKIEYEKCDQGSIQLLLSKLEERNDYLSEKGVIIAFLPIISAIYSLHQHDFIHRNITKSTILIGSSGLPVLGGLELIRKSNTNEGNSTIIDQLHLPKEVLTGSYTNKVDVFSAGLILYQLCTNRNIDRHEREELYKGNVVLPRHLQNSQLKHLIIKMCDGNPKSRTSAKEVMNSDFINLARIMHRDDSFYVKGDLRPDLLASADPTIMKPFDLKAPEEVLRKLGEGGFGSVDLIKKDGFELARKKIDKHDGPINPINEIKHCQNLIHENIIYSFMPLCSRDENDGPFYIYLEKCENSLSFYLNNLMQSDQHLSIIGIFKILCCMVNALYWIHKNNCVHRDIKTDNILVTTGGNLVLSDLGCIGQKSKDNEGYNTRVGTPGFMAAELLFSSDSYTESVDIYALGCLIYLICSYKYPPREKQILLAGLFGTELNFEIPKIYLEEVYIQKFITRMTSLDKDKRITIDDLIDHPVMIKYNYLIRNIPFIIDGKINPFMIMHVDLPPHELPILPPHELPILPFKISAYMLEGTIPLPNSKYTYLDFPIELGDEFISDICYIFPKIDVLINECKSLNINFHSGVLWKLYSQLIDKFLVILGFRITIEKGHYKIKENPGRFPWSWGTNSTVMHSLINILTLLRYFTLKNTENKSIYERMHQLYMACSSVTIRNTDKFPYYMSFNKSFLSAVTCNGKVDEDKYSELFKQIIIKTKLFE